MTEVLRPPVSKSDTHRALVLAELCNGEHESWLPAEPPRDVDVLSRGLVALRSRAAEIDCVDAGAPFRFLVAQAAVRPNVVATFRGTERLLARPHDALLSALERGLRVRLRFEAGRWPLLVTTSAPARPRTLQVSGVESSQFASALLLAAAWLVRAGHAPIAVENGGDATSAGYLELTCAWLRRFGFEVRADGGRYDIVGWSATRPPPALPGDWSSLTYLLPLAWASTLAVEQVDLNAKHPDQAFATHLQRAGLSLETTDGLTRVVGVLERGFDVDASQSPDAVPGLVALALVAKAPSVFHRAGVLRLKESDRLAACVELVEAVGGTARVEGERLAVTPAVTARAATFDGRDDHRMVMAAAVAGRLLGVEVTIRGTDAVAKSFPSFWREAEKAGVVRREGAAPHG